MDTLILFLIAVGLVWWFLRSHSAGRAFALKARSVLTARQIPEERYYEQAATEIAQGHIRPGLWAKAYAEANGDETAAKARYIKLRVQSLRSEVADFVEESAQSLEPRDEPVAKQHDVGAAPSARSVPPIRPHGESVTVHCPACEQALRVPGGRRLSVKCSSCGIRFEKTT